MFIVQVLLGYIFKLTVVQKTVQILHKVTVWLFSSEHVCSCEGCYLADFAEAQTLHYISLHYIWQPLLSKATEEALGEQSPLRSPCEKR